MSVVRGGQGFLPWGEELEAKALPPWLATADPTLWSVAPDWQDTIDAFWQGKDGQRLQHYLDHRLSSGALVYPPEPLRALKITALAGVRVVILGQDPYHGKGQAEGLAFSVAPGMKLPPSLRNVFKELQRDLGRPQSIDGSLVGWAEQGVLLLNTCLTVEDGQAASHAGRGWEVLTDTLIRLCSDQGTPKVFMLWGAQAQKKVHLIDLSRHRVLLANHPSPLSASRGPVPFLGCGHFGDANRWLSEAGQPEIRW